MNTFSRFLATTAVTLGVTLSAQAGNALMSPKAKEQANARSAVATRTSESIDRSAKPTSPRYAEFQRSLRTARTTGANIDRAHAKRPTLSPKDQRYQAALQQNAVKEFQVAPLK